MQKIIALCNNKGGVGKTTTTVNLGVGLANLGKKVMIIDLDPQANASICLGITPETLKSSIYEVLKGSKTLSDIIVEREGLYVAPANLDLSGADLELGGMVGREFLLKEIIDDELELELDYILIDCPPSLGLLTMNALTVSQEVYIILQLEALAVEGLKKLIEVIKTIKKKLNKSLDLSGVIGTFYDSRKTLNRDILETVQDSFDGKFFKTIIRDNVALAEAPTAKQSIFEYSPTSKGAADYTALSKEVIARS